MYLTHLISLATENCLDAAYKTLDSRFQDQGFSDVVFESAFTKHGPFSWKSPFSDDAPGPPL
jgi:hypothetical protein